MIEPRAVPGRAERAGRGLRLAAGCLFAGLIVFAPLNFGSTRAGGPEAVSAGCGGAVLFWALSVACCRRRPRVPLAAALCAALLGLAALPWIAGIATPTRVALFTQLHFAHVAARWPLSIVWRTPRNTLVLTLALAASVLALIDLMRAAAWALVFSIALVSTAAAVAVIALLQNFSHATGIYWRDDGRMLGNFWGTFYHHTAAGAYLNTAWPLALALTLIAWRRPQPASPALPLLGLLATIVLIAAHFSHVSRFPQVAALIVAPFLVRSLKLGNRRLRYPAAAAVLAIVALAAVAGRTSVIGQRWGLLFYPAPAAPAQPIPPESAWPALIRDDLFIANVYQDGWMSDRGESWRTALRSIAERPLSGHGPGNWIGAASQNTEDPFIRTFFLYLQFAHQDLLQFAVEWGVPAALGWWGLLAGGLLAVIRARFWVSSLHRCLGIAAACGLAAVLLQAQIDFPLQMPAIALNAIVLSALAWAAAGRLRRHSSSLPAEL